MMGLFGGRAPPPSCPRFATLASRRPRAQADGLGRRRITDGAGGTRHKPLAHYASPLRGTRRYHEDSACQNSLRRDVSRLPAWSGTLDQVHWGELEMTLNTSEVAVCCSNASPRSAV